LQGATFPKRKITILDLSPKKLTGKNHTTKTHLQKPHHHAFCFEAFRLKEN
jgi:hypothetical protein